MLMTDKNVLLVRQAARFWFLFLTILEMNAIRGERKHWSEKLPYILKYGYIN